jgi:hypothetical protein
MKYLLAFILISCTSGNAIRDKINANCQDITLPREAFVNPASVQTIGRNKFMPVEPYNVLADHSYKLRLCAESLKCGIEWTEWERDCELTKSPIDRMLGISCKLEKPSCRI